MNLNEGLSDLVPALERRVTEYVWKADQARERAEQHRARLGSVADSAIRSGQSDHDREVTRLENLALLNARRLDAAKAGHLLSSDLDRSDPLPVPRGLLEAAKGLGRVQFDAFNPDEATELKTGSHFRIA